MPLIDIDAYLKKIDNFTDNGNLEQAAFHCLYLLRQFPKMLRIYGRLGRAFLEMDNYSEALNIYLRLCSAQPDNFLNHISLAYTYVEHRRPENAIEHCETAICLEPDNKTIEKDLSSWMTAHSVSFSSDDKLLIEFSEGIRAYREKNYAAACKHFLAAEKKPRPNLPILYLGLSYFENGDINKGKWLLESVLRREPYNITALRTLCVYYSDLDQIKFKHYLDKLIELDPLYQHWEIREGQIFTQRFPINISYYDWTGIPKARVRIGWHQASEKLILNDNTRIPAWLDLLPITDNSSPSEESITGLMNEYEMAISTEGFYRKAFFSSKIDSQSQTSADSTDQSSKVQDSGSELDRAFNYLEHIASRGFEPIEPKQAQHPPAQTNEDSDTVKLTIPDSDAPSESQPSEEPKIKEPTIEDRQRMRDAWRCFSTDQQELGVQLYRKILEKPNCVSAVKEELEKLVILFPDNTELAKLFNSISE